MFNRMRRSVKIIVGLIAAVVVLAVVAVALFILTRDEAPEAVDLETAVARLEAAEDESTGESSATDAADEGSDALSTGASAGDGSEATSTDTAAADSSDSSGTSGTGSEDPSATGGVEVSVNDGTADASSADTERASSDQTADGAAGLAGVWTVQVAEGAVDLLGEPTVSFAGFRVNEVLSSIGDFTAVGRTANVAGSIELTETALVAVTVEVQMGTLRTDNSFRDGRIYQALNTRDFPLATFTLVEPVELPGGMADGEAFAGSAQGDLTVKDVTNRVTFDLQAQLVGDRIVAVGSSEVIFSDYGVTAPTAPIVVSVEDHGIMEFQLLFTR